MQEVSSTMKSEAKCRKLDAHLPDLLFDPGTVKPSVREHLDACADCQAELASMRATIHMLDDWAAPDVSPYFDVKMQAKLRAEKETAPEGFWERMRSRLLFSTNLHLRTASAGVLAAVLVIGGGAGLYVSQIPGHTPQVQESATVRDLQALDGNAQVFQQLNALDTDDTAAGSDSN